MAWVSPPHITLQSLLIGLRALPRGERITNQTRTSLKETALATVLKACRDFDLVDSYGLIDKLVDPLLNQDREAFERLLNLYGETTEDEEEFVEVHGLGQRNPDTNRKAFRLYAEISEKAGRPLLKERKPRGRSPRIGSGRVSIMVIVENDERPWDVDYDKTWSSVSEDVRRALDELRRAIRRERDTGKKEKGQP